MIQFVNINNSCSNNNYVNNNYNGNNKLRNDKIYFQDHFYTSMSIIFFGQIHFF